MLSREIVKLTRSNDRPCFHRGRNFFTRDSCNRAAFTKRCNYGWPVVAVDTDYKPAGSRSRFSPTVFERFDRDCTGEKRERNGTGERSKLQVRGKPLGALLEDADDRGGDVLTGRFG